MARAVVAEEKAMAVVALMEVVKKEAAKAIPRFKASEAFVDEVAKAVLDSYQKGFEEFWGKARWLFGLKGLENIYPDLPTVAGALRMPIAKVEPEPEPETKVEAEAEVVAVQDAPLAEAVPASEEVTRRPRKELAAEA